MAQRRSRQPIPDSYLEPDYAPHLQAYQKDPTPQNATQLLQTVQPILSEALRTYAGSAAYSPALQGRAKLLALDALQAYDPSQARLRTHLLSRLQSLRRLAARSGQAIHIPEGAALDRQRLQQGSAHLEDELGRSPSDTEIADRTGLSLKRMAVLRTATGSGLVEGQLSRPDIEGGNAWTPPIQQTAISPELQKLWLDTVYTELDPVDQQILAHTHGLHGHPVLTNQEIAHKVRLSPGAISQRRLRIQSKLNLGEELGLFGGTE